MISFPVSWETATLRDVCTPVTKMDPVETGREKVRYIDIGSVDGERHCLAEVPEIEAAKAPSRCRQIVRAGDTVFSTVRPYLEKIALVDSSLDCQFASTGFSVLRPGERLEPSFLYYFAISRAMLDQVLPFQKGVSYPAVLDREVRTAIVPVPPLDEQRRIVAILEDHLSRLDAAADYVTASRRRLVALERAALDRHFGGMEVRLGDLIEDISAGKSFGAASAAAKDDQWGIIKVSAMTWGEFDPRENKAVTGGRIDPRFEIRKGDLLVSRANTAEYVGSSVLVGSVRPKLLLSDKSLRVTPKDDVKPEWLWRALQAPSARRQITALATGTKDSMRNIAQGALKQVRLPRADETKQADALEAFAEVSAASAGLHDAVERAGSRLSALRRSLLAAAFAGRLTGDDVEVQMEEDLEDV